MAGATESLVQRFQQRFGSRPRIVGAPGRVNLIGEHTDYSGGFVMPAAIQLTTFVAFAPRRDRRLVVSSETIGETIVIDLSAPPTPTHRWSDYVAGVANVLIQEGCEIEGADMLIASTVPRGSGLSSSAALEVAAGFAMLSNARIPVDRMLLALSCQRAENEFVGARCGIMDQYVACLGVPGSALLIDCRSLESCPLRLPPDTAIVVCNTMVRHAIAGGEYNARRADVEEAAAVLARAMPHVSSLRDVTLADLQRHQSLLPPALLKRARHVVTENARAIEAADALKREDLARMGALMAESHASLRDNYEVSCTELNLMVELAGSEPGVIGTRMTGGGFGGCTVSLVESSVARTFVVSIQRHYEAATGTRPDAWICVPSGGVEEMRLDE